jgi:hypothetical protein
MTGTKLDYNKHCRLPFGAYVETHGENDPTNTMVERTRGAILGPMANFQGSYKFLCLDTGRHVTRKQFRETTMPASVIKRVAAFSLRDKQAGELVFTDRNGNIFAYQAENEISVTGAHTKESTSAGVDISEHESSQHDEPPVIIMETDPNNPGQNLGPTTGAQLGANAGMPQGGSMQDGASAGYQRVPTPKLQECHRALTSRFQECQEATPGFHECCQEATPGFQECQEVAPTPRS